MVHEIVRDDGNRLGRSINDGKFSSTRCGHARARGVKLRTIVENKNSIAQKLDGAFVLIGPADETPHYTARTLFQYKDEPFGVSQKKEMPRVVTDRIKTDASQMQDGAGRMIIPLPYYFLENYDIADENLSYEQIIFCDQLPPGAYASRFYIEASHRRIFPRLHRVVHAALEVPATRHPTLGETL